MYLYLYSLISRKVSLQQNVLYSSVYELRSICEFEFAFCVTAALCVAKALTLESFQINMSDADSDAPEEVTVQQVRLILAFNCMLSLGSCF